MVRQDDENKRKAREEMLRQWHNNTLSNDVAIKSRAEARLGLQIRFRELKASRTKAKEARDSCKVAEDHQGLEEARKTLKKHGQLYGHLLQLAHNGMPSKTEVKMRKVWAANPLSLEQLLANVTQDGIAEFPGLPCFFSQKASTTGEDPLSRCFQDMSEEYHGGILGSRRREADMTEPTIKSETVVQRQLSGSQALHAYCIESDSGDDDAASINEAFENMELLLSSNSGNDHGQDLQIREEAALIQHAPLLSANIISGDTHHLVPQYGLLASHTEANPTESKLFLNTNVPFSIFLCGVQGSGKSHTTSCILENSLLPSKHLGKLQNPLSALVFSYGQFDGDGVGFSVSEAAFLAAPDPELPSAAHVKGVNVLVSPSNYVRISKLYQKLPNVSVTPFRIKPQNLDIDTMLTLMNVSESDETPLYMAQVTQILREMSTAGGPFDYKAFKLHLKKQKFNPTQDSMLRMRLNLLESFLDMDNSCLEPRFRSGEITIMDMSCPFVDANTACIFFRLGLQRYLQSKGAGKMIVLDEAHKYMLNVPGAKSLNEALLQTVRLQRHYGARVIISTQEPTLLTDLIALCSVTVIHRFSSPEWFTAIRRHVPVTAEDRDCLMRRIEGLTTGKAIIYSPNAVLGRDERGNLVTGTSRMINVSIRRRITSDGGQSVFAV